MKAVVIGIGRRGGNCVSQLSPPPSDDVTLLFADTDLDDSSCAPNRRVFTSGRRSPSKPSNGTTLCFLTTRRWTNGRPSRSDSPALMC